MYEILTADQVVDRLRKYNHKEVHIHHTWRPDFEAWNKRPDAIYWQKGMRDYHINTNKWTDIGQHLTITPDGQCVTGRAWDKTPASISGYNTGAFAIEMIGDFDVGRDKLVGIQKEAIIKIARYFDNQGKYVRFHRDNSSKTCPGSGIDKTAFMADVRGYKLMTTNIGTVTATALNVRSGVGTSYKIIGTLKKDAPVVILDTVNGWHKIKYNDGIGYVSGKYVKNVLATKGTITATALNVRSGPGTNHKIIGTLKNGAEVDIISTEANGWHRIVYSNTVAYISGKHVQAKVDTSAKPNTKPQENTNKAQELEARIKQLEQQNKDKDTQIKTLKSKLTEINSISKL